MSGNGARRHVVVFDDDEGIRDLFSDFLSDEGYRVSALAEPVSPAEVAGLAPHLVIVDQRFVGRSGVEFIERLRTAPETRTLPLIMCSADARLVEEAGGHLAELGVPIVAKPFDLDRVKELVAARVPS